MKDALKSLVVLIIIALVLAMVAPFAIFTWRLMESWTAENTGQLLGGLLAILGGAGAVFAAFVGAGVFGKLAGWKPPRRDEDRPPIILEAPPQGWDDRPQLQAPPVAPPWGMTGGGQFDMLPAPQQDRRFSMSVPSGAQKEVHTIGDR